MIAKSFHSEKFPVVSSPLIQQHLHPRSIVTRTEILFMKKKVKMKHSLTMSCFGYCFSTLKEIFFSCWFLFGKSNSSQSGFILFSFCVPPTNPLKCHWSFSTQQKCELQKWSSHCHLWASLLRDFRKKSYLFGSENIFSVNSQLLSPVEVHGDFWTLDSCSHSINNRWWNGPLRAHPTGAKMRTMWREFTQSNI